MTLKKVLAEKEAAEAAVAPPSHSSRPSVAHTLEVEPGGCEFWILPWSQFVGAHYHEKAGCEELILRFTEYEVRLQGRRLARLRPELTTGRLELLRSQPHADMTALKGSEPVISCVRVYPRVASAAEEIPARYGSGCR